MRGTGLNVARYRVFFLTYARALLPMHSLGNFDILEAAFMEVAYA